MTSKADLIGTLEALAKKRGMSLWTLKAPELGLILMSFTQTVRPDETFTERGFSARLEAWLEGEGDFLRTDFADLRRALVDLRFFERDVAGKVYRRAAAWPARWRALCKAVEGVDLSALLARARAAEADRREERKRAALSVSPLIRLAKHYEEVRARTRVQTHPAGSPPAAAGPGAAGQSAPPQRRKNAWPAKRKRRLIRCRAVTVLIEFSGPRSGPLAL